MIEKYLSIQDSIAIFCIIGIIIKFVQFFYFDRKNKTKN